MMNILAIDTTSNMSIVALSLNGTIFCEQLVINKSTSETLLLSIQSLLNKQKIELSQLDAISIVVGPGSFTGIRVGLSTVKAFLTLESIKGISINKFELLQFAINKRNENSFDKYLIVINSGTKDAYVCDEKGNMFFSDLESIKHKNLYCNQSDFEYFNENGIKVKSINVTEQDLLELSQKKYLENNINTAIDLQPVYIKYSQAEKEFFEKLNTELIIEKAKIEDIDEISQLEQELFTNNCFSKNSLVDEINNSSRIFLVAKFKHKIIGYTIALVIDKSAEILKVAVNKTYQRLKIASKLLKSIIEKGFEEIHLEVNEKNEPALNLYKKFGFIEINKRLKYYDSGDNCLVMKLSNK